MPLFSLAQQTYVPDGAFENYLETHTASGSIVWVGNPNSMGNGIANDGYVTTANINTVTSLNLQGGWGNNFFINDFTGIEDFVALTYFVCRHLQLTSLDVSQNTALTNLYCDHNQLTSLDVSQNTALTTLDCSNSQLTSLDVSQNTALIWLSCDTNQLTSLDLRNGNNMNMGYWGFDNPNLTCIDVDDEIWSTANWNGTYITDPQHYFSNNCSGVTDIQEHSSNKELLKVTDLLGRETKGTKNEVLFYIYDDRTLEKRIIIE